MCCVIGYTGHDMSADKFKEYLMRTVSRGPDDQRVVEGPFGLMGFGRLAIMGLTPEGMQPFELDGSYVVFEMSTSETVFCAVQTLDWRIPAGIGAAALLLVLALILGGRKHRKKKKAAAAAANVNL